MAQSKRSREMVEGALGLPVASDQVGLGVDIVEIERVRAILRRSPAFARRAFSEEERAYCDAKANPEAHYATRFAAKEAVLKALGTGFADGIGPRDVEVRRTKRGKPYVVLSGRAREVACAQGVREVPVSLSFTHSEAVACAMAITQDAQAAAKKREDPMEELAKQFKDARALLDELPALSASVPSAEAAPSSEASLSPGAPGEACAPEEPAGATPEALGSTPVAPELSVPSAEAAPSSEASLFPGTPGETCAPEEPAGAIPEIFEPASAAPQASESSFSSPMPSSAEAPLSPGAPGETGASGEPAGAIPAASESVPAPGDAR